MGKADRIDCSKDVSMTQQSGADECDINLIVERAKRGAMLPVHDRVPQYGDFTSIPNDLRDCLLTVRKADEAFMSLDAVVRKRFENDPAQMLDFLNDPKNRDEAVSLGLVAAPPSPPVVDPVVEELRGLRKDVLSGAKKSKSKDEDE